MDFLVNLTANQWQRQETQGRLFLLTNTGTASSIELRFEIPAGTDEQVSEAKQGFKARLSSGHFSSVMMRSTVNTAAKFVISDNDIEFDFINGATVNAIIQNVPLPVSNDRGAPGNLLYVSGVSLADAPAVTTTNTGPFTCGSAGIGLIAANAARRAFRAVNLGPDPVTIGVSGLTWAKRVIVLDVGDLWVEERAANLAWFAYTDAAKTANVNVQEVTA